MNVLLICPGDRSAVPCLAENAPLAAAPVLGRTVIEHWLDALAAQGLKQAVVLASDRPQQIRTIVGNGARWGIQLEVVPQNRELTPAEARIWQQRSTRSSAGASECIIVMDTLPGIPDSPLFSSYASWYAAVAAFVPHAATPGRIGVREVQPGIWIGLHTKIAATARLEAPCWIGQGVVIADHVIVGPGAMIDDHVAVERGARIRHSIVGPNTFVGQNISLQDSLAHGSTLVNWTNNSCLRVPDAFFLCSLSARRLAFDGSGLVGRTLALASMLCTAPVASAAMLLSLIRGENPLRRCLGVRPQRDALDRSFRTFAYYELTSGSNWLKRWPQFWSVARGDLRWVGNRPLRPTQATSLVHDFERLWLSAPVGLVSLADAHGCTDGLSDEVCGHASYYAVHANRRLDWMVLTRALFRAASAIPIRPLTRRKPTPVLPQLVSKQEG
jgi:hypothetical protein